MRPVTGATARAAIAHCMGGGEADASVGTVTLHAHQVAGVEHVRHLLRVGGGALLADDVGMGKTFTALALARGERALVIAPAGLRGPWHDASTRAQVAIEFISLEEISRGRVPTGHPTLVIVDEAHHLRSSDTRRFAAAAFICRAVPVLLLSATPVQNREADLRNLLSLFLGQAAHALPVPELTRYVVRRTVTGAAGPRLPDVREPAWLDPIADDDCLDRILALPPPVPPRDGGVAETLVAYSLTRQWSSSRAALSAALRRRLARGHAIDDALRAGRLPSHGEIAAWTYADGAQQLSFAELIVPPSHAALDCASMRQQVALHLDGVRELLDWLAVSPDPDAARAARLHALLRRHAAERIVAFSEFSETVSALFARLGREERVAMLTHTGGRVAGGPLTRSEILDRFTPGAAARTPAAERIDLLLTTDVLSEGVGLHDAGVAVHLDLSWNPARLEQRVGRLRRLGSSRETITVYLMRGATGTDRLLRMEERLRGKLSHAARTVGLAGAILPGSSPAPDHAAAAEREWSINQRLRAWRTDPPPAEPVVSAVRAGRAGALVCVRRAGSPMLVVLDHGRVTADRGAVHDVLEGCEGSDCDADPGLVESVTARVADWLRRTDVNSVLDLEALRAARARRFVLRRVDRITRRTPRHAQSRMAPLVRAVRAAATARLPVGAERVLDELAHASLPDEAWLQAVGQFAELHTRSPAGPARIEAVLLLVPPDYSPSAGSNSSCVGDATS